MPALQGQAAHGRGGMFILGHKRRLGAKVRIDGRDASGKMTTRMILIGDATIEEVEVAVRDGLERAMERPPKRRRGRGK